MSCAVLFKVWYGIVHHDAGTGLLLLQTVRIVLLNHIFPVGVDINIQVFQVWARVEVFQQDAQIFCIFEVFRIVVSVWNRHHVDLHSLVLQFVGVNE